MGNLFKKAKSAASNYVGSVAGDANAIGDKLKGKFGSKEAISNMFDQRVADGLSDLLTGATGIRTSNIPEINDAIMKTKSANREARAAVLNGAEGGRKNLAEQTPPEGVKLQYPENFPTTDGKTGNLRNYMHFRSLQRRKVGQQDKANEKVYDIFLYVPNELADSMAVTYTDGERGFGESALASLFGAGGVSNQMGTGKEALERIIGSVDSTSILKASAGKTVNPLAFQLFEGVTMRDYSYTFKFQPINETESRTIQEITYAFRKSMLPGTDGDNARIWTFPNEWAIRYHGPIKKWVDYPMVTVCTGADVDWASSGEFTHHLDGAPTVVELSLSFSELSHLDRNKFDDRVSGFLHGSDNVRETSQEGGSAPDLTSTKAADTQDLSDAQEKAALEATETDT
ncbi:MAG: hypothetical protein QGH83_02735 [Candidatus Pacebacteria bacterium]|nr:hypothetical protein [Candidatus Paceibacterota bacterium]